ncbi:MAG: acyl carrier protein [Clostridia bacterium]
MAIKEKVIKILAEKLELPVEDISVESDIYDDLDADSIDLLEVILEVENEFDCEIDDQEIADIRLVGDAIKLLEERIEDEK